MIFTLLREACQITSPGSFWELCPKSSLWGLFIVNFEIGSCFGPHYVAQAGLDLTAVLPASASQVLGLQTWTTMASSRHDCGTGVKDHRVMRLWEWAAWSTMQKSRVHSCPYRHVCSQGPGNSRKSAQTQQDKGSQSLKGRGVSQAQVRDCLLHFVVQTGWIWSAKHTHTHTNSKKHEFQVLFI